MSGPTAPSRRGRRLPWPRPTVRLRLTLLYGALFLVMGAALLGGTYVLLSRVTSTAVVARTPDGGFVFSYRSGDGGGVQVQGMSIPSGGQPPDPQVLTQQIQSVAEQQRAAQLGLLAVVSAAALAVASGASLLIGWGFAGRVLRPLRSMTADVRAISASSLERRLATTGPDDELKDLGTTFNDLLARLQRAFEAQRHFVANASHELRTPLARQRTLLQVALADPDASVASLRETGERVLAAGRQQEALIEALFTLARGEQGLGRREPVDLAELAAGIVRSRTADLDTQGVRALVRLDPAPVTGDPRLLERLVSNLVDNAARYNRPGGTVDVSTRSEGGRSILRVVNTGAPVPAADADRLFQPFQRLGTDRTGHGDGWGLGLSIVWAIASAHDGVVAARPGPDGGLEVEARFPIAPATPGTAA